MEVVHPLPNTTTVTVIVRDINDNGPVFSPTNVTINLREDHSLMQPFYSAGAVDDDEGDNANITYSIVSQSYGNFSINPNTGALSLVSTLDFEMATSVLVVIEAADRGQSQFTDQLYLNISVEDIDDRLPRFQPNFPTSVSVNESALPGHVILRFQAIISPPSEATDFAYSISDHMGDFILSSNMNNEALIEVISLDREIRSRYSLNVTIINTDANLRNSKLLEVIVTDTNDNPPTFNMLEYTFEVMENSVGAEVGTVVADDSDDGENSMINFAFQGASNSFHINPETGRIETLVSLDYDTVPVHNLMVLATDMGNPSKSTSATVSISVIDVNDNPPRFSLSQEYEFSVREDDSVGTIVGTIVATDVDSGNFGALTYAIEAGDPRNHFSIIQEGGNGMITVSAALDRESVEEYTLVISVSDNNGIPLSHHNIQGNFTITVTDVNDNAPVFSSMQVYAAIVPENEAEHLIATITANDVDTEARSMVSYDLGSGNYNNAFRINPSSGELRATKLLDYEANIFYPLEVIALDGGSPARRSVQVFNITVANVNDHTPQFALPFYEFSVREGPSSTSVTMTVQAVDGDLGVMGEVMYRITSQVPDADFEIDSTSGEITAARQLNYEHHSEYELVVEAVDMDQNEANRRRSSTIVRVVVENINDNRPSFLNLPYTIWLSESVSVNTIAYVASAVDADTNTLQFSIAGGNQDNKFTVNSQTGEVFVSSSLDRDVISRYDLTVIVTDGSLVDTGVLMVEVEDVNDNAPVFSLSPYTINVSEGANVGDVAGRIIAADADEGLNAQLEYSLVETSEYFSIDGSSGNLTLLTPLDRDNGSNPNPITLRVKVTDKGIINRNSNTSLVEVNVTDINDNLPVFTRSTYRFTIRRDFRVGVTFGVVNATDADEGSNAEHVFDIVQNPHGLELFSMNQTSGELSLKGSLEMGSLPLYWIRVRARDLNRFESFASVEIVVTDVNDNPPFFPQEEYSVELMESVDTPRLILPLSATDSDSGMNSFISYEFGEAQPNFTINESTGDIELTDSLDHERRSFFTLLVYAVNRNGRNGSTIVHVNVVDVNDNIPEFQNLPTSLTISEVPYTGLEILHVVAMDPDSGSFGQVSYSLVTEAARSRFSIDNVTGVVTNLVELTASTTHVLEIEATDGGGESRRANITLTVADHSSQSPDFSRESISLMISENYPVNTVFHQFNASNRLTSPAFIQYRISNFSDEAFALNQTTGELMLNNSLDFEQEESYYFIIESFQEVSNTRYSTYLEVVIVVVDVNDNAPVFNEKYTVVTGIRESIGMNQVIVTLDADDADSENNGQVNYEITEGNVGEVFSIAPTTGQIIVVRSLDRESVSAYRLVVTATDEGTPPLSDTAVVDIGISDDNDVTPSFRNASYVFRVSENSTLRSVVGVVSAVDPDLTPLQLHYIISSLTASLDGAPVEVISLTSFEVNRSSGEILLNHNLNRGQVDKFELQVDATDGVNTNSTNVIIIVQDANNNRPVFDSAGAINTVIIPELSGMGTPVFQFTATDADFGRNGIVQYRLGNDWPSGQFEIDPVTGIVTLLRPAPLYQVSSNGLWVTRTVVASDMGDIPLNSSITVRISLRDINNHPPSLSPSYNGSVFNIEDVGTEVLSITAGDQDQGANANVSYYISHTQGPISVPFSIEPTTGRITVSGELTPGNEIFTVIAINEDPNPFATHFILSSTATVEIRVNRMNRYYPQFNQTVYHGLVLESEDAGTNIVQVYATDDDEDTTISFSIQSSVAVPFAINANGLLSVNGELDRETTNMYSITIVATDDGVPPKNATARVRINIIDVNDNEPTFTQSIFEASVTENVPKGTEVTTITASDTDLLENAAITYRLNDTSVFNISTQTGRIYSIGSIDRESVAMYYLQIVATDNGNPVQSSSAVILVTVNGENEFEPRFNDSQETFFPVPSGLVAGSIVGRLVAYDDDQGKEGELKFTFLSYEGSIDPKNFFYINSSGFIILNVSAQEMRNSASSSRRKRQTDDTNVTPIVTIVEVEDSGATSQSDELRITLSLHNSYIPESPIVKGESDNSTILVVITSIVIAVVIIVIIIVVLGCVYCRRRRHGKGKLQLYSPAAQSDADSTRPSIVSFTTSNANGIVHGDARAETGTRQTTVPEAGHAQVSTTSDSEPASGIFGDDESESVSGMQSRARANNPEHVSPNGRHRSPQHSRPPPISRSTSDLAAVVNGHNSNGFLRRTDDEEAHPYTRDQLIAIYAANANLLTNSPSQDSIHMFGSEGGGEADGDIDMDNYMFAKFAGGLDSADEESVVGMNNDTYTVSSRGRSSIASRSSAGAGIDEGPEDLWRGSRQGFRPHRVTDVIDEMHAAVLSQESLSQSKEKRKPKPPHTMQFQETSFTKKPSSGSYARQTGSMQNVRYPEHHIGNSQYEGYDGRRSSKSHYASSGAIYPLSYSSRASELTLPPYRAGEAPPPYATELSPPLRAVNPAEMRRGSQSSDSDSSEYPAPNPTASYGPQPISPQPSLPTTNSTMSLDNPIFQSLYSNKHFKVAKGVMPHPHSGSVPQINMYNAGSVHGNSIGQGLDRPQRYNVNNGNLRA